MVNISRETPEQVTTRLKKVIKQSRLTLYPDAYIFEEFALDDFKRYANNDALALVRDDQVWSQLVRADSIKPAFNDKAVEHFAMWRFHFPRDADNSGFVGWLAMHLKDKFGTGVFVVCGQNSADGGIFDYWGAPWSLRSEVIEEVQALVNGR